jgi:NADH:ubiquinone oxidoreductase subunit 3 (subunit A)
MDILILPLMFIGFLMVAFLLGWSGRRMAPKEPTESEAQTSYAGGENIPGEKRFPGYKAFYPVALFFTVLHVLALLLALLPQGPAWWLGLSFAGIIGFALAVLIMR